MAQSVPEMTLARDDPPEMTRVDRRGFSCALYTWRPAKPPIGLAVVLHGYAAHARYPTVLYAARVLVQAGFAVCAFDLPGHGASDGQRAYVPSAATAIEDSVAGVEAAKAAFPALPALLVGSSMGGALAVQVSLRLPVDGLVLLAPMLAISLSPVLRNLLWVLSYSPLARLPLIGSNSTDSAAQYADPERRAACDDDPLSYHGRLHPASASACVELANDTRGRLAEVAAPFLLMLAGDDRVVDNAGSEELATRARTPEGARTVLRYPGALHGLLCEAPDRRAKIEAAIAEWALRCVRGGA